MSLCHVSPPAEHTPTLELLYSIPAPCSGHIFEVFLGFTYTYGSVAFSCFLLNSSLNSSERSLVYPELELSILEPANHVLSWLLAQLLKNYAVATFNSFSHNQVRNLPLNVVLLLFFLELLYANKPVVKTWSVRCDNQIWKLTLQGQPLPVKFKERPQSSRCVSNSFVYVVRW